MSDPNMEDLSPAARALLDDARDLDGPTPADRDRNKRALVAALASGAGLAASTVASSTAAATTTAATATTAAAGGLSLGVKIAAVALVAVAVGGTALVVVPSEDPPPSRATVEAPARARDPEILRPGPAPAPSPAVAAPAEPDPVDDALPPALEPAAPEAVEEAPAPRVRHVPATRREIAVADSTLSEELVLLREAQRALQAGRASEALGYLGDHARRFPSGVLEEEREAQRVVALCQADRAAEARALASRFLRERPTSPLRERVRAACP